MGASKAVHRYSSLAYFISRAHIYLQLCVALACNALEVYTIPQPSKSTDVPEAAKIYTVDIPGHRTDVRTLSLSSDDQILASASNGGLGYLSVNLRNI
jgi:hypothetical protein